MFIRTTLTILMLAFWGAQPAFAQTKTGADQATVEEVARFADLLQLQPLIEVIAAEGRSGADDLQAGFLNNQGGQSWDAAIAQIYDPAVMLEKIVALLHAELAQDPETLVQSAEYFATPTGRKAVLLEVDSRRALLTQGAEAAAEAGYYGMVAKDAPRVEALSRLVRSNDLIESNVMTALNSNFAFLKGMAAASGNAGRNEADMLAEVWAGEAEVRKQTEVWLYPYLALAYEPMSDAELEDYIAFSNSPVGKKLNAAIFRAFDAFVVGTSTELGKTVGKMMIGQDI